MQKRKFRAFTMTDFVFGAIKVLSEEKNINRSALVSLCIMEEWERECEKKGKDEMKEKLANAMKALENE